MYLLFCIMLSSSSIKETLAEYNEERLQIEKELFRKRHDRYTRKAFRIFPDTHEPGILDVGCGSGAPILELARLNERETIGIDNRQKIDLSRKYHQGYSLAFWLCKKVKVCSVHSGLKRFLLLLGTTILTIRSRERDDH